MSRTREASVGNNRNDDDGLRLVNAATTAGPSSADAVVVARSDAVRRDMECPVCLELAVREMRCRCPNKHVLCETCLARLTNQSGGRCPICRAPFVDTPATRAVTDAFARAAASATVACAHRHHGCTELFAVRDVTAHEETECRYRLSNRARCQVSGCGWYGYVDDVFGHVNHAHPQFLCDLLVSKYR